MRVKQPSLEGFGGNCFAGRTICHCQATEDSQVQSLVAVKMVNSKLFLTSNSYTFISFINFTQFMQRFTQEHLYVFDQQATQTTVTSTSIGERKNSYDSKYVQLSNCCDWQTYCHWRQKVPTVQCRNRPAAAHSHVTNQLTVETLGRQRSGNCLLHRPSPTGDRNWSD